jgi:protein SCO1/2
MLSLLTVVLIFARQSLTSKTEPLEILGTVPDFTLTERSGKPFGSNDLAGKVWIADFIFTSCAGTCPIMTTHLSELQAALTQAGLDEIKLVSCTVDPETDTPEVLSRFANGYGALEGTWFFLTGPSDKIQELANKGFMLAAASGGNPDEAIIHSNRFVLVDAQGRIRKYYLGTEPESLAEILRDIKSLLAEAHS